jgi:hypothetical protein
MPFRFASAIFITAISSLASPKRSIEKSSDFRLPTAAFAATLFLQAWSDAQIVVIPGAWIDAHGFSSLVEGG